MVACIDGVVVDGEQWTEEEVYNASGVLVYVMDAQVGVLPSLRSIVVCVHTLFVSSE